MEEIRRVKEELCNDFVDGSNENIEIYIDTPDYISIKSLTEFKLEKPQNRKSSLKTNKNETSKEQSDNVQKRKKQTYKPKPRSCEICGKEITSSKGLLVHMRIHNDEKPFKCELCDKSFRQSGALATHTRTHSKEKPYPCPNCDGSFTTTSSLKRHLKKIHETGKSFGCTFCREIFYSRVSYQKHREENHTKTCFKCGLTFTPGAFWRHKKEVHMNVETGGRRNVTNTKICIFCGEEVENKTHVQHKYEHLRYTSAEIRILSFDHFYPCKICQNQSSTLMSFLTHMANHMEKTHTCGICNEKFPYYLYKKHNKKYHDEVVCKICKKRFSGFSAYRAHKYRDHTSQEQCSICKKQICSKRNLDIHMRVAHTENCELGQRNYQCVYCHQLFITKSTMTCHIIRYHRKVLQKSCNICNLKFEYFHELTKHMQNKHAKPLNGKPITCHICKRLFRNRETLKTHIYRHKSCDETSFNVYLDQNNFTYLKSKKVPMLKKDDTATTTCKLCFKEMPNKFALRRHAITHSINYKHCRFCNTDFESVENLKRHFMKSHSKEKVFRCDCCLLEFSNFRNMMTHRRSQRHRKQYWLAYRTNNLTENKKIDLKIENNSDNEFMKEEIDVLTVKTEPVEEDFSAENNNIDLMMNIKSET